MKRLDWYESLQRGSPGFPLDYGYLDESHPRYQMPYHWHEEHEILLVLKGEFDLVLDGQSITMKAGDVVFMPSEAVHGGEPRDCVYECIVFDMRQLMKSNERCKEQINEILLHRVTLQRLFSVDHPLIRHTILPMMEALRERCVGWELITLGCLFRFLGEAQKNNAYEALGESYGEGRRVLALKRVFELIESEYHSRITLDDLAAAVHMTPKYFCRFFKEAVHRTPIDYLNYYRIETACSEIAATDKSLTEVALDCGFGNLNYFIRQFKKYKSITPGQYMAAVRS